jgi:hypothetical protein
MATKKKTKKKSTKTKNTSPKNRRPVKKTAKKKAAPKKKLARKKPASKKAVVKTKALGKKTAGAGTGRKSLSAKNQYVDHEALTPQELRARSAGQSGDLQGLSSVEDADSESVDELIEEGNAFEADVVAGVERAGDADEQEVRTHEVPEDDVPEEYLDKD